jgi:serine/threonine protein phosphatase PrpC
LPLDPFRFREFESFSAARYSSFPYNDADRKPSVQCCQSSVQIDHKSVKPGMEVASLTDIGRVRENNEDSYLYWEPDSDEEFQRKGRLAVIADGMGGHEGGLEASRMAVGTVREVYERVSGGDPRAALIEAFNVAHQRIQSYADAHPVFHGMGTTCTALVVAGRQLYFAHVGDSRLYLVRDATISRLTRDHSYVSRLVEIGIVDSRDAENHPQRHILTAALGSGMELVADILDDAVELQEQDTLILCTDGLWGVVAEEDLAEIVRANTPADSCAAMVRMALERGGPDNITVQILRVGSVD